MRISKTGSDNKLKNLDKKFTSNKAKHVDAEKEITDLTNKVAQISEKSYDFLLGRMYFTGDDVYQNFFTPMLSSVMLDSNKKVTNWMSTGISSEKINLFNADLEPTMSI